MLVIADRYGKLIGVEPPPNPPQDYRRRGKREVRFLKLSY
jgi:hypothetical protein